MAISRKAKVPKAVPKIVYRISYNRFSCDSHVKDVTNIYWFDVINKVHPDAALDEFMKLLLPIINKHEPVTKLTVRTVKAPRIDEELNNCMVERDGEKGVANKSDLLQI